MTNQLPSTKLTCTACQSQTAYLFIELPSVPILCNVLWSTRAEALAAPRVDIRLAFCPHCGHIFNPDFDPSIMDYNVAYENSLHFSPRFQTYVETLAQDLVKRYDLHHKMMIDIGGGKGDFLKLLCDLGDNRGVSIDPSYAPATAEGALDPRLTFIQDYYAEQYAHLPADFICSRHTLEHIQHPRQFLSSVRRTIGDRLETIVFFEVPNALFTLHDMAIWDIIYEHCSYFTAHSLAHLFSGCGFQIHDVQATFANQFLVIEATPTDQPEIQHSQTVVDAIARDVAAFAEKYRQRVAHEEATLKTWQQEGKKVVLWGSGSKGITFLNTLHLEDQIHFAVDINPRKHGKYITGAGQQIVPPSLLQAVRPDIVLVMNPVYEQEIGQMLRDLNVEAELVTAL